MTRLFLFLPSVLVVLLPYTMDGQCVNRQASKSNYGYASRGKSEKETRCEGLVDKETGTEVEGSFVSATLGKIDYEQKRDEQIEIHVPTIKKYSSIDICGSAHAKDGQYYLDCNSVPGKDKIIPIADVIINQIAQPEDLGIFAHPSNNEKVIIPIRIKSKLSPVYETTKDTLYIKFEPASMIYDCEFDITDVQTNKLSYKGIVSGKFSKFKHLTMKIPLSSLNLTKNESREFRLGFRTSSTRDKKDLVSRSIQLEIKQEN